MLLNSLRVTRLPTEADIQFSFFNRILLLPLSSGWAPVLINSALFLKRVPLWPCKANNYLNWHLTPCIVVVMLVELCSAHCLPPCPVNLKRSAGGQLKEVVEVSVAEAFRQLEGDLTLMLKISRLSPSVPPPPIFFLSSLYVCVRASACLSVCVRASRRFEKSTSNLDLPKPLSRKRRRCQDVQHQKVSTMSLLIYSYLLIKIPAEISGHFKMASADNGWHFWSAAFRRWLWTWKDIYAKKCDGCFRVTTHTKKKSTKTTQSKL